MSDSGNSRFGARPERAQVVRLRKSVGSSGGAADGLPSADLFAMLWNALADMLGTAAAATLLRRATQRAVARAPELTELIITRGNLEYEYAVPAAWRHAALAPPPALCELARELWPLLVDLTGPVVVSRLEQIPELRRLARSAEQEAQP